MTGQIATRLAKFGIELPTPRPPVARYLPAIICGSQIYISGQVCSWNDGYHSLGRVGAEVSLVDGQAAARLCGLNIIAQLQAALGDLDRVKRCVKLTVFVRSADTFTEQPQVANGASELMWEVFGEAGAHARSAVGVSQLPFGVSVEVDAIFEIT